MLKGLTSLTAFTEVDYMQSVTKRTSFTSRGSSAITPWIDPTYKYATGQLFIGNNFISKLEIVSALNSFNITHWQYAYEAKSRPSRFYPKLYLSTIQTTSPGWNQDDQNGQNWVEKSGSLLLVFISNIIFIFF